MGITKRCEYALRAIFELTWRNSGQPMKIRQIAEAQEIPQRFLESIMNDLKHAGFVDSRRGNSGGYILMRNAKRIKVS